MRFFLLLNLSSASSFLMPGEQTGKDSLFYISLIVSLQDCSWLEAKETAARQNFGGWRLTKVAILIRMLERHNIS